MTGVAGIDMLAPQAPDRLRDRVSAPGVADLELLLTLPASLAIGERRYATLLQGLPERSRLQRSLDWQGREAMPEGDGVVLGRGAARAVGAGVGDRVQVTVLPFGPTFQARVDGINEALMGNMVTMRLDAAQKAVGFGPRVNTAVARIDGAPARVDVRRRWQTLGGVARITDLAAMREQIDEWMGFSYLLIGIMLAFSVVLAGAVLFNTATLSILERMRELATQRALGAPMRTLTVTITLEHAVLAGAGAVLGLPLSSLLTRHALSLYESDMLTLPHVWSPVILVVCALGATCVLLLAQWPGLRPLAVLNAPAPLEFLTSRPPVPTTRTLCTSPGAVLSALTASRPERPPARLGRRAAGTRFPIFPREKAGRLDANRQRMKAMTAMNKMLTLVVLVPVLSKAETVSVSGLKEPVEILTDRWGVAHIYAKNEHDLFFAQGYNACRDRTFQFELWRRQATGTMAEILGRRELERDIGTRLHLFRKDLDQELNHYHPRGKAIIEAFVEGVNAWVEETLRDPGLLPIEFELLGIRPGHWTPADVISRHQGLLSNVTGELRTGQAVHLLGAEAVRELGWYRPGKPELALDPEIDGSLLTDEILGLYRAFRRPVEFKPEDIVAAHRNSEAAYERLARRAELPMSTGDGTDDIGSNNWVVCGRLTSTGFPYVVNDPHRVLAAPSLRYLVHLVAPGWNVIGGGEPVLPGVSIGHNEYGAWGLTVFGQDNEDLYVYDTNPANAGQYRYLGGWEAMKVLRETIAIEGAPSVTVELKYTRHGPVLYEDRAHHKAYALRAAWMEIGSSPYLASLRMDQAKTWEEFVEACSYSRIPAENMIWGDVDKNIGYQAVGISPIRPNWSGLVPVPGDGRYEWDGFLPIKALPHVKNPDKGYWGTANNFMVPDGYPHPEALHWTWGDEIRGLRVDELLSSGRRFTIADMVAFQHDELSIPARSIVPLLEPLELSGPRARKALDALLDWDFVVDRDSVAAAIYVSFERRLLAEVAGRVVPEKARGIVGRLNKKRVIDWLFAPDGRFGDDPLAGRDAVLRASLTGAVSDLTERLGPDMTKWQYGQEKFKHVLIRHPMSAAVGETTRKMLDVGPAARGGYDSTLNNTSGRDNQVSGASFRVILDASNWDNSIATNAPGQSGHPASRHYRDLFDLFVRGRYFPLFYTREKVESVVESAVTLEPAGAAGR